MKNPRSIVLATLVCLMLIAAFWAVQPTISNARPTATSQQNAPAPLSVSGKITQVAKDSFTLAVGGSQTSAGQQFEQDAPKPKSMTFSIDKNTTIEGQLKVNANADVTYREDNGKNIAISVHVTP